MKQNASLLLLSLMYNFQSELLFKNFFDEILKPYISKNVLIVFCLPYSNQSEVRFNINVLRLNYEKNCELHLDLLQLPSIYFISVNRTNYNKIITSLSKNYNWNSRAKFVIFNNDMDSNLIRFLCKSFIYNIIIANFKGTEIKLSTINFFKQSKIDCNSYEQNYYIYSKINSLRKTNLFRSRLPKFWPNETLTVGYLNVPPYIIKKGNDIIGLEVRLLDLVQNRLKFNIKWHNETFEDWGTKRGSTYTGAFGALQRRECHLVMGIFHPDLDAMRDFDMTQPYLDESFTWVVPKSKIMDHTKKFFSIFTTYSWIGLLIYFFVLLFLFVAFNTTGDFIHKKISDSFMISLALMLSVTVLNIPKNRLGKFVFLSGRYVGFVILTAFQAKLISHLIEIKYEKQISNVKELIDSNLKLRLYPKLGESYKSFSDEVDEAIYKRYKTCDDKDCLRKVALERTHAVVRPRRFLNYIIPRIYMNKDGTEMVYVFKENIFVYTVNMYMVKGHPIFKQVDSIVGKILNSGFDDFWDRYSKHMMRLANKNRRRDIKYRSLNFRDFYGAFALFGLGFCLSFVIFCFEFYKKI